MGNHDARIEDNHRDLHELMGTIGYMKEDLHKLVNMNQRSHIQDSPPSEARQWRKPQWSNQSRTQKESSESNSSSMGTLCFSCIFVLGVFVQIYPSKGARSLFWRSCRFRSLVFSTNISEILGIYSIKCRTQTFLFMYASLATTF